MASHLPAIKAARDLTQVRPHFSLLSKPHTSTSAQVYPLVLAFIWLPTILPFLWSFLKLPSLAENVAIFSRSSPSMKASLFPQTQSDHFLLWQHFVCLLWHLPHYAFHYITVAYVPYDFNVLQNVGQEPPVSFEITSVSHDLNFRKWNRVRQKILECITCKHISHFGLWSKSLKITALLSNVFSFYVQKASIQTV